MLTKATFFHDYLTIDLLQSDFYALFHSNTFGLVACSIHDEQTLANFPVSKAICT